MNRNTMKTTALTLILLASTILLAALSQSVPANAQTTDQAIVILLASAGGTTTPAPGNYSYDNGTVINLAATPDSGFKFAYWVVSGALTPGHLSQSVGFFTDPETGAIIQLPHPISTASIDSLVFTINPVNITCGYGYTYTYQAVFAPTGTTPSATPPPQTLPATNSSAIVTILPSVGGSSTPAPGTYAYANGTAFTLSATPASGFAFHYWVIAGGYTPGHLAVPNYIPGVTDQYPTVPANIYVPNTQDSIVFSINPVTITCGYGYTYTYQAVFDPINATVSPIPTTTPSATQTPAATATPTATSTPVVTATPSASATPTPTPSGTTGGLSTTDIAIIIAVIIIIIIIIAVVAVMMRRKK